MLHYTEIIIIIIIIIIITGRIISAHEGAEEHVMTKERVKMQRVSQFILFTHYYYSDKIQKDRLGRACSTRKRI